MAHFSAYIGLGLAMIIGSADATGCVIDWAFAQPCSVVAPAVTAAVQAWAADVSCGDSPRGETCDYIDVNLGTTAVRGYHMSFDGGFISDLGFVISEFGDYCTVSGHSFSTKEDVTDPDFNYCTLQWVITESDLTRLYGYRQETDDDMCVEYPLADCEEN